MAILGGIRWPFVSEACPLALSTCGHRTNRDARLSRGWATSSILRVVLAEYVAQKLRGLDESKREDPEAIEEAIKSAFVQLDDEIISDALSAINEPIPHVEAMCRIAPASSGSCALLSMYDPATSTIRVAGLGDSRAVLGRQSLEDGNGWKAIALSMDHTGFNTDEKERIAKEHPDEDAIDLSGRVLGSAVTRSFGDNRWKWSSEALKRWESEFFGRWASDQVKTPPYITAIPAIESEKVQPGDFLILGSDGFWNHMSNEDAVYCVSLWLNAHRKKDKGFDADSDEGPGPATKQGYPYNWIVEREHFTVEDSNVATHLVRNAFGGKQRDLFCSVLSTKSPDSKEARDDVTVVVVVFHDSVNGGVLNEQRLHR
jgi:pyruvate dehydrogenase phosphatase